MQNINLIKIRSPTYSPLQICYDVVDLMKPHYGSYTSNPMYHPMKMGIARLWKCFKTALHATSSSIDWKDNRIYHIIINSRHKVTHMRPVLWFLRIFYSRHASKGKQVGGLILIRLVKYVLWRHDSGKLFDCEISHWFHLEILVFHRHLYIKTNIFILHKQARSTKR